MNAVLRSKQTGQSIPLIALMMVVLFAMVGLSVDVGNTYAEQRTAVRASNAAAIAAMDAVIKGNDDTGVAQVIRESLKSNGLSLDGADNKRRVLAYYMDIEGKGISNCQVGQCAKVPSNVNYIQVSVDGKVDTYFARVVGRDTLPVNTTAFSGRCAPTNGVYPIAISNNDLDANGFTSPLGLSESQLRSVYGTYIDDNYPAGKPWRRIYLKANEDTNNGYFSWLRWSQANWDSAKLAAGLTGEGNLAAGFQEADWPANGDPKPNGYPLGPGGLSVGDLVYGNPGTGWSSGDGVYTAVRTLLTNRTLVLLPIIDTSYGSGSDSKFKVTRLGKFYIVNATGNGGISPNSSGGFIDLVYLGTANESACLVTNVDPVQSTTPPQQIEVRIPFEVKPRWRGSDRPDAPIAYQLVVDVSGSMSFDFDGNGTLNGTIRVGQDTVGGEDKHCEGISTTSPYPNYDRCQGGPNSPWRVNSMRRIALTKAAIREFVNGLGPYDTMRYTAFSSRDDYGKNNDYTQVVPSNGFTNDKAVLLSALNGLGSINNDPNRTAGGTPGAQALQKAKSVILAAPQTAPNGKPYRRVVVYLTDGVANVFLNGTGNDGSDKCSDIPSGNVRKNTPRCQIGYTKSGMALPITAMIDQADAIKTADPTVQVYVMALAGVATDGLKDVASSPSMLYPATQPSSVDSILRTIQGEASGASCLRQGGSEWTSQVASANWGQFNVAPYNVPRDVNGKATIYNEGGTAVIGTYDITADPISDNMGIRAQLPPGVYQMEAWVGYKGQDNVSRVYKALSTDQTTTSTRLSFTVVQDASLNSVQILPPVYTDLDANTDVCAP